jgi:hypothetical protein
MTSVAEAQGLQGQMQNALRIGLQTIDRNQQVTFVQYTKFTSPIDGFVSWVASGTQNVVNGSFHYSSDRKQDEDQTIAINKVVFTATQEVAFLNNVAPDTLWVGSPEFDNVQFSFGHRSALYFQADLWHYTGDAVYPALSAQLVASKAAIPTAPIVSNSLPIWLTQNSFAPVYASFLVPDNVVPPYIAAHVEPALTDVLQQFPSYKWPGTIEADSGASPLHQLPSSQLMRDNVRLTLYGFNNQTAIQFMASLIEYSLNTDNFGFCNSPAIRDDKRTQVEMAVIAMKKHIDIVASYYQSTADALARRLILSAAATINVGD